MALTGTISFVPIVTQTSQLDLVTGSGITPTGAAGTAFLPLIVTNGVGANQATNYVSDNRTLAAAATEILDFNGGLVDSFGNLVAFTRLIFFLVHASPQNLGDLQVVINAGGITTFVLAAGTTISVPPGGTIMWAARTAAAYAVGAGATDLVTFINASAINSAVYDIIAVGS